MQVQVNDRRPEVQLTTRKREASLKSRGRRLLLLMGLLLSLAGTACTENDDDDLQCGTPEWPCDDDGIVTDDSLEI